MLKLSCARILGLFALSAMLATRAMALPEVAVGTGYEVTPGNAWSYYNAQGITSPAWSEDAELDKLAAALGDDTDRIYEYVRNEVDVIPLFGVHAGARGAYIDKAGTPFDQAQLMVELLRSAGKTATYQVGDITLTGTQFNDWFGLTNPTAVKKLLADGGVPATVTDNGTTVTSVTMLHVWVLTPINGTTYAFDPSFKSHTVTTGIDVGAVMTAGNPSLATFWTNALVGATTSTTNNAPRVVNLNRPNVRSNLNSYATTLLNNITANHANSAIENLIGGRTLVPYAGAPLRQTSLPYQGTLRATFANDLPLVLRKRVSMTFTSYPAQQQSVNWVFDEIYGKQIVFVASKTNPKPPAPAIFSLQLGEQTIGTYYGTIAGAQVTINNPYASGNALGVVDGAYRDRTVVLQGQDTGSFQIVIGIGRPSPDLAAYQERTHTGAESYTIFDYTTPESEEAQLSGQSQQISTRRRLGTTFLTQFTDMMETLGGVSNAMILVHEVVGSVASIPSYGGVSLGPLGTSFAVSMEPAISPFSKTGDATVRDPLARAAAMMTSALEGATTQAVTNAVYPVSAVAQLDWNYGGPPTTADRWQYYATSANWAWVQTQLVANYEGGSPAMAQATEYINAGYIVLIPRWANLGPAPALLQPRNRPPNALDPITHPDRAGAFIAIHPTTGAIAHISSRWATIAKGGGGSNDVEVNPAKIFAIADDFLDKQFSARANAGSVDLKSGTLTYTPPPDITVGNGGYPYSLSFQRSFRSGTVDADLEAKEILDITNDPAGPSHLREKMFGTTGWTSNFHHHSIIASSGEQMFGRDDPRTAVQSLVLAKVLVTILTNGASNLEYLQRQIVGAYAAAWWTEAFQENTITVNQGHASRSFYRVHNTTTPTFVARGSAETAELWGTRTITIPAWGPSLYWYRHCVRITGAQKEISYYGLWNSTYTTCVGNPTAPVHGNFTQPSQGEMFFVRQTFPFGITVTFDTATNTLSNNLGRSLVWGTTGVCDPATSRCVGLEGDPAVTFNRKLPKITDLAGHVWDYAMTGVSFKAFAPTAPTVPMLQYDYAPGMVGSVASARDAVGNTTAYRIAGGRVATVTDALGHTARTYHNEFGNVRRFEDALGRVTTTEYDNYRRKVKETAPEGNFVTTTYDTKSNVLSTTATPKPGSPLTVKTTSATYNAACNVPETETDELGRVTDPTINATTCKVTSVAQPAVGGVSPVTSYLYNAFGQVTQKTDPTGVITQTTYNATNGNVVSVILDPGTAPHIVATTTFQYDAAGNVTQMTDPRGNAHTASYDNMRRLVQYNGPAATNTKTKWTYDADGLIIKIERAANAAGTVWTSTDYNYWPTGRVRTITDPDGRITRHTYDALNRISITTDPENRQSKKHYDAAGQVIEDRRAVGTPQEQVYATYSYTPNGKQAWVKDAKLNQTSYSYDGFDRTYRNTYPDATFEEFAYDARSNVTSKLTRSGQLIQNTYDTLDRLSTHLVPQPGAAPAILTTYTYDLAGRTASVSDNAGHSLTNGFDSAKRLISVTQAAPNFAGTRVVSYQLDLASNKTRVTYPGGYFVNYAFDAMNRMTTATENGTFLLATYVWDTLSRRTSLVYGNGTSQTYGYSNANDMQTLAHTLSGTANTFTHTHTKAHQIASETASNAAWQYVPTVFQTTAYAPANNLNQYVNVTVGANPTQTLGYDGNGNLTGDGTWTFAYDAQNILRSAAKAGTTATYAYDPLGRRQAKTVNGAVTTFLSDGDEEIAEYDGANALLRRYVTGPGTDMPIAMVTVAGVRSYFHANRQGSVVAMSAANGTIAEGPYTYDAYGNGAPLTGVPFKYTGRRLDPETGLYYYRARFYSSSLGRFLQTDPVGYGDGMNLYGYVGNDPLNATDPTGKISLEEGIMAFGKAVDATIQGAVNDPVGTAVDFTPILGDLKGAVEFLQEPTVLGGVAVIASVVPVVGDVAAKAIRGIDKVADTVKAGQKAATNTADAAKGACCFVAGTLVMTSQGLRPIEDIEVGDKVLARDEATGETGYKPVTQLIRRHDREIWTLVLASNDDGGKAITAVYETTDDHPWRSTVGTWLQTMELRPGVEILRARGPPAKVVRVENTGKTRPTFNLEVADHHTYFVGELHAWVHNARRCGGEFSPSTRAEIREENRAAGGGTEHCVDCGVVTIRQNGPNQKGQKIDPARSELDHDQPVADGGSHDKSNGKNRCHICHKEKTKAENADRAAKKKKPK